MNHFIYYRCACCNQGQKLNKGLFLPWNNSEDTNVKVCKKCIDEMYDKEISHVETLVILKDGE